MVVPLLSCRCAPTPGRGDNHAAMPTGVGLSISPEHNWDTTAWSSALSMVQPGDQDMVRVRVKVRVRVRRRLRV